MHSLVYYYESHHIWNDLILILNLRQTETSLPAARYRCSPAYEALKDLSRGLEVDLSLPHPVLKSITLPEDQGDKGSLGPRQVFLCPLNETQRAVGRDGNRQIESGPMLLCAALTTQLNASKHLLLRRSGMNTLPTPWFSCFSDLKWVRHNNRKRQRKRLICRNS